MKPSSTWFPRDCLVSKLGASAGRNSVVCGLTRPRCGPSAEWLTLVWPPNSWSPAFGCASATGSLGRRDLGARCFLVLEMRSSKTMTLRKGVQVSLRRRNAGGQMHEKEGGETLCQCKWFDIFRHGCRVDLVLDRGSRKWQILYIYIYIMCVPV